MKLSMTPTQMTMMETSWSASPQRRLELVGAACGRRYSFEQREHTIKLLGKQVIPSQIPGFLVQFKV
jgi:hypothetical protein